MTAGKYIEILGCNFLHGETRLEIEVRTPNGSYVDGRVYSNNQMTFEELYCNKGRKAVRWLRKTYGPMEVRKPSTLIGLR